MFMILHAKMLKLPIYALLSSFGSSVAEEGDFLIRNELSTCQLFAIAFLENLWWDFQDLFGGPKVGKEAIHVTQLVTHIRDIFGDSLLQLKGKYFLTSEFGIRRIIVVRISCRSSGSSRTDIFDRVTCWALYGTINCLVE